MRKSDLERTRTRSRFLEAAGKLFIEKGYEETSVNDIITAVDLSKGAFYHHFTCKDDVLMAVVEQWVEMSMGMLTPLLEDPGLTALDVMERFFNQSRETKMKNLTLLMEVGTAIFDDRNPALRQRYQIMLRRRMTPAVAELIERGNREGVFDVPDPQEGALTILSIAEAAGDRQFDMFIAGGDAEELLDAMVNRVEATMTFIERILAVPRFSFTRFHPDDMVTLRDICRQRAQKNHIPARTS